MNKTGLEAAVAAAAKVKAKLIAKGKLAQSSPPLRPQPLYAKPNDAVFTAKMTINDCSVMVRNLLTKGSVQEEICKHIDGSISTKGRYLGPGESHDADGERPLYLYIQGTTQATVNKIMNKINELIKENGGTILESIITSQPMTTHHYVQDKVFFKLDNVNALYNLKEKIIGPNEKYLQHIRTETSSTVVLRGKGSGHIEPMSGQEAFEPLHLHIVSKTNECLEKAKALASNLIETVQTEYAQWCRNQQAMGTLIPDFINYPGVPYGPLPQGHNASNYPPMQVPLGQYQNSAHNPMVVSYPMMAPYGPNSYPTSESALPPNSAYPGYQEATSLQGYPSAMQMAYPPAAKAVIDYRPPPPPPPIGPKSFSHHQADRQDPSIGISKMSSAKENPRFSFSNSNVKLSHNFRDESESNCNSKFQEVTFAVPLSLARKKRENNLANNFPESQKKRHFEEPSYNMLKKPRLQKDAASSSQNNKRLMPPPSLLPKQPISNFPTNNISYTSSPVGKKELNQPKLSSALQGLQGYGSDSESDEC